MVDTTSNAFETRAKDILKDIDFEKNDYKVSLTTSIGEIQLEFFPELVPYLSIY